MIIAMPAKDKRLDAIRDGVLVHLAPNEVRDAIIQPETVALPPHANCRIHLKAAQGWSPKFWKFIRDLTVWDTNLGDLASYGRYNYFFLGKPSDRNIAANVGATIGKDVAKEFTIFTIRGEDMMKCSDLIFYRPLDKVVVVRGDYRGPAMADPIP